MSLTVEGPSRPIKFKDHRTAGCLYSVRRNGKPRLYDRSVSFALSKGPEYRPRNSRTVHKPQVPTAEAIL